MADSTSTIRFSAAVNAVADHIDNRIALALFGNVDAFRAEMRLHQSALRALAALVEQCETATQHRGFPSRDRALQLCHLIAAGYRAEPER